MKHLKFLLTAILILSFFAADAQIKISALPTLTDPDSSADVVPIVHSGTTYKITVGKLFNDFGYQSAIEWKYNGNTVGSEKWIGTVDNFGLPVRVNNSEVWSWETNGDIQRKGILFSIDYSGLEFNTSWGQNALANVSASSGVANSAIGYNALTLATTGSFLTAVGSEAGASVVTGGGGSYYGWRAGVRSTGDNVTLIGNRSGSNGGGSAGITSGDNVTAVGALAGLKNTDGAISNSSYFGFSTVAEQSSEVVIGGKVNNKFYFGVGKYASVGDLVSVTMQPNSPASGSNYYSNETNANGINWTFGVSQPTGTGTAGDMIWQFAPTVQSSGTTQNALSTGMTFKGTTGSLVLSSTLGAFTPNILTTTQRNALTASDGMLIYNSTTSEFNFRQGGSWATISGGGGSGTVTSIATTSPITGGTITTTGTIGIDNAAADGTTKGAASFAINDFNSSAGLISIDYTNGQAASGSTKGFLSSADWSTFNGKQAAGSYLVASGATTGAASQPQVFTNGIKSSGIDDNTDGTIELTFSSVPLIAFNSFGIQVPDGTFSNPSYLFTGSSNTGYYLKSTTEIGAAIGGALKGGFNSSGLFTDVISEQTAAAGVTIDGVLLKDGLVLGDYGGTGVNNTGKTITLGGNLTTSGANALTFTTVGATNVTLPTSGTLVTSGVTTLSSLTSIGTIGTGTWQGSVIAGQYGGTGVANTGKTITVSGNTTIGSSTNTVAFATSGNTSVTLPTSGTLATLAGTETLTGKSIVATQLTGTAYTFGANNTSGTAAYTLNTFEDHPLATYAGTVTFNSTPPSSITVQQYAWSRIGNTVTLFFSIFYGSPGTTNTSAIITLPSDCPAPVVFANAGDAASEYIFPVCGARVEANMTGNPSAIRGGLRQNASNNGYEVALIFGSVSATQCQFTISYRTN